MEWLTRTDLSKLGEETLREQKHQFVRDQIQPHFEDAKSNCELMKVLLSKTPGIEQAVDACSSNAWKGTIGFQAMSDRGETIGDHRSRTTTTEQVSIQFRGEVPESEKRSFRPAGTTVALRVRGKVMWDECSNETTEAEGGCGVYRSISGSRTVSAADSWLRVDLNLNPGGTYGLVAGHIAANTGFSGSDATETSLHFTSAGRKVFTPEASKCAQEVESRTTTEKTVILIPPVMLFNGNRSGDSVTGGASVPAFLQFPPTDGRYNRDFKRLQAPQ